MMELVDRHFGSLMLMLLLFLLIACHAFMMHFNRPQEMIRWVENIISADVAALISVLSAGPKEKGPAA